MTLALNSFSTCPECGGFTGANNGYVVCRECGLAIEREFRNSTYTMGQSQKRPTQQYVGGASHMLAGCEGSYIGSRASLLSEGLKPAALRRAAHLRMVQIRYTRTNTITRHIRILRELYHIGGVLDIPQQVLARTATILKKTLPHWSYNGFVMSIAALVQALREFSMPILETEIVAVFDDRGHRVSCGQINKARRFLWEKLELKHLPLSPLHFLPRVVTGLQSDPSLLERLLKKKIDPIRFFQELERSARQQLQQLQFRDKGGRHPFTLAASCCYAMSRHLGNGTVLTQAAAGNACGCAEYSVRDHYSIVWKPLLAKGVER